MKQQKKYSSSGPCLLLLFLIGFFIVRPYWIIHHGSSLNELLNGEVKGGQGVNCVIHQRSGEFLIIHHKLFYFIPFYDEHYCLVFNDDYSKCIAVREKTKWLDKFDDSGYSEDGVLLKGCVKKLRWKTWISFFFSEYSDSIKDSLSNYVSSYNASGYYPDVETIYYLEPRPIFNLNTIATILDIVDTFLDAAD